MQKKRKIPMGLGLVIVKVTIIFSAKVKYEAKGRVLYGSIQTFIRVLCNAMQALNHYLSSNLGKWSLFLL